MWLNFLLIAISLFIAPGAIAGNGKSSLDKNPKVYFVVEKLDDVTYWDGDSWEPYASAHHYTRQQAIEIKSSMEGQNVAIQKIVIED